jgi:hypothetical protein
VKLTQERLKKLKKLNKKLFYIEEKIITEAKKIDQNLQNRLENKNDLLNDYELEAIFEFYMKGCDTPIATINENLKAISQTQAKYNDRFLKRVNHNEFLFKDHPMQNDYHCWLFHSLYDHEHLSWKNITKIKDIDIDLKVYHQYSKII